MVENPFSVELAFFESHRAEFIERGEGKFVLIKGEELVDFFDTPETAYKTGVDRFGLVPFFIRQVLREEQTHDIPAYRLGLIHARV